MKRIAIFCDGTWNRPDARYPTNVYHLHKSAQQTGTDGVAQILKYIPGVGTGFGKTGVRKWWDKVWGGATGAGVTRNILAAYRFLAEQYEPGDEIYIFGFSRGAFTARSLAGMIRASGLPPHEQAHRVEEALKRYRDTAEETRPGTDESHEFRLEFSPLVATSPKEVDWRVARGEPEPHLLSITYLGVWDTVGALGIPGHYKVLSQVFNGSHGFHDTELSSSVKAARHAVAIDERRKTFPPTLWNNLAELNAGRSGPYQPYQQLWFSGDHGSVGGGGDIVGLSNIALRWIAEGAAEQGLVFDVAQMEEFLGSEDFHVPLHNQTAEPGLLTKLLRRNVQDRVEKLGPAAFGDVSDPARRRWREIGEYRPKPLLPFQVDLDAP
ncbi:DUF2235 domain-containing protein [Pseudoruegeria sp. HB172150]|uniref:DUF2235 domain-containing protein n=1 Tax=Pseudoruegeria sp. HB172150 TaxID=2721164 RepID=UPI001555AE4A|nr:DUF2235 domain-containing protein [Pseudoruegeria sp. HB172150]